MTGRERLLCALNNQKADHLPAQIHGWMDYYLKTYLGGKNQWEAYEYFDADLSIYLTPEFIYDDKDLANWQTKRYDLGTDEGGVSHSKTVYTTPEGELTLEQSANRYTCWTTKYPITNEREFELWNKYVALPVRTDWSRLQQALDRIGDRGILRSFVLDFGQGSPWQSLCTLQGTENCIFEAMDEPQSMHYKLDCLLRKKMSVLEQNEKIVGDVVECGGGAGSNTVISPKLFEEFCLPYDQKQHALINQLGPKVVYHLCGGLMQMLPLVAKNGAQGLETMTPPSMGGDCDLRAAYRDFHKDLFFIGGFDQNAGFEKGDPALTRKMVFELHDACPDGGYILCPSDHFFFGGTDVVKAFFNAAKECRY